MRRSNRDIPLAGTTLGNPRRCRRGVYEKGCTVGATTSRRSQYDTRGALDHLKRNCMQYQAMIDKPVACCSKVLGWFQQVYIEVAMAAACCNAVSSIGTTSIICPVRLISLGSIPIAQPVERTMIALPRAA